MHYLVVARNGFETVAMSATSIEEAERIRDGFVEDSERRMRMAREEGFGSGTVTAVASDIVILSRAHAGTLYREG